MSPITVIMLTLNEAHNLPDVFENIGGWAEEIFIVDSLSTDRTVDIALENGAKIVQRPFTNFGDQWNFALERLPIKTVWTLKLDPDERLSEELKQEISEIVSRKDGTANGYDMMRRLWFMGKPLHVKQPVLRLWKTGKCRFSDVAVNEHPLIDGNVEHLKGIMEHIDSPDLHHWFDKQNRYTTMEAIMQFQGAQLAATPKFFGSSLERRMFLKNLFWHIPLRFQLLWCCLFLLDGVWRGGWIGRQWVRLRVNVYRTRELKKKEMQITGRVPEIPRAVAGDYDSRIINSSLQKQVMSIKS